MAAFSREHSTYPRVNVQMFLWTFLWSAGGCYAGPGEETSVLPEPKR